MVSCGLLLVSLGAISPRSHAGLRVRARGVSSMVASPGLVLAPSRTSGFDDSILGSACVKRFLTDDGESWLMWYSARSQDFDPEVARIASGNIGLATSTDGVTWTREGAVLTPNAEDWFYFDTTHVGLGDVQVMSSEKQRTGGVAMYWCYYFGGDATRATDDAPKGAKMSIGLAMSSNGRNWGRVEGEHPNGSILTTSEDESQFDAASVFSPQVVMLAPEKYVLYYHAIDREGKYTVGVARGKDGVKFDKVGPIMQAGPPGSFDARGVGARHVIESQQAGAKRFLMFYEAVSDAGVHSIGLATSDDGLAWTKVGDRPVFGPNPEPGSWDGGSVGRPNLVRLDNGRYRLYYYGQSGTGMGASQTRSGIGMAECQGSDWFAWERTTASIDPHA